MTFLELASAIDKAEQSVQALEQVVYERKLDLEAVRKENESREDAAQIIVNAAEASLKDVVTNLNALFAQLAVKLPNAKSQEHLQKSSSELKDLYQNSMKVRGK